MMLAHAGVIAQAGASGPPPGPSLPIDWSTDLLFARASAATYWDGTTLTRYASGAARILGDGSLYVEGARTNRALHSVLAAGGWTGAITASAGTDPSGGGAAARTSGAAGPFTTASGGAGSTPYVASIYLKRYTVDGTVKVGVDPYASSTDIAAPFTSVWTRGAVSITSTSGSFFTLRQDTAAYLAWGAQSEKSAYFASQLIETAGAEATRLADDAVIEDADVPAAMRSGAWEITIKPRRASTQANDTTTGTLFAFGSGTDNRIHIDSSNRIVVREGGVDEVTTGALTWSADQAITLTFDAAAGSVTVAGATTGNGTTTGTAWTMPSGDVQVGNDAALGTAFFGSISPPVAP